MKTITKHPDLLAGVALFQDAHSKQVKEMIHDIAVFLHFILAKDSVLTQFFTLHVHSAEEKSSPTLFDKITTSYFNFLVSDGSSSRNHYEVEREHSRISTTEESFAATAEDMMKRINAIFTENGVGIYLHTESQGSGAEIALNVEPLRLKIYVEFSHIDQPKEAVVSAKKFVGYVHLVDAMNMRVLHITKDKVWYQVTPVDCDPKCLKCEERIDDMQKALAPYKKWSKFFQDPKTKAFFVSIRTPKRVYKQVLADNKEGIRKYFEKRFKFKMLRIENQVGNYLALDVDTLIPIFIPKKSDLVS